MHHAPLHTTQMSLRGGQVFSRWSAFFFRSRQNLLYEHTAMAAIAKSCPFLQFAGCSPSLGDSQPQPIPTRHYLQVAQPVCLNWADLMTVTHTAVASRPTPVPPVCSVRLDSEGLMRFSISGLILLR